MMSSQSLLKKLCAIFLTTSLIWAVFLLLVPGEQTLFSTITANFDLKQGLENEHRNLTSQIDVSRPAFVDEHQPAQKQAQNTTGEARIEKQEAGTVTNSAERVADSSQATSQSTLFWDVLGGEIISIAIIVALSLVLLNARLQMINSKLKESEAHFRHLYDAVDICIFEIDADCRTISANAKAIEVFGENGKLRDGHNFMGFSHRFVYGDGTPMETDDRPIIRALKYGETLRHQLVGSVNPQTGATRWYDVAARPSVNTKTGRPEYVFATLRDVTEERATETKLRRSEKMDALGQIVAGVAHDFNNALAIVTSNLELLKLERKGNREEEKMVEVSLQSTRRCIDLTRRLLAFSRKKANVQKKINVNSLLRQMETFLPRSLTSKIEIHFDLDSPDWRINVNVEELENAIINLAVNARDAMGGAGKLTIFSRETRVPKDTSDSGLPTVAGDYVEIGLTDTGVGIEAAALEKIFEPFFTTKPVGKGTGLGLSMVYGFVTRSGGEVRVSSCIGVGTTIRLFLPRCAPGRATKEVSEEKPEALPRGNEMILLVDDEPNLLESTCKILERLGYTVLTAGDGEEALEILGEEPDLDLLISDIIMPGETDGFELAEKTRDKYPNIKLLLSSGYSEQPSEANENGLPKNTLVPDTLSKPYTIRKLATTVRRILDEHPTGSGKHSSSDISSSSRDEGRAKPDKSDWKTDFKKSA